MCALKYGSVREKKYMNVHVKICECVRGKCMCAKGERECVRVPERI